MAKQKYPPRIMYIEYKGEGLHGSARIGRVTFSRTGASLHYGGKSFGSLGGGGFKANYRDIESGEQYWISGPRRDGTDRLYKSDRPVEIDEDVREEYWTEIRKMPEWKDRATASRSLEMHRKYIAENPVKAGLVGSAKAYPFCYEWLRRKKLAGAKARDAR